MVMKTLELGMRVLYVMDDGDVQAVNAQRSVSKNIFRGTDPVRKQMLPMVVTKIWGSPDDKMCTVNGQVFMDGNDTLWVSGRMRRASEQQEAGYFVVPGDYMD